MNQYVIGCDPGFGECGLVLRRKDEPGVVLRHLAFSTPPNGSTHQRVSKVADRVREFLEVWYVEQMPGVEFEFCLERPIWKRNADSFEKQWRTFQAIATAVQGFAECFICRATLVEVPPTTSKRLATGDGRAKKDKIVECSPFAGDESLSADTRRTLADAWAHSLAAYGGCTECARIRL